MNPASLQDMHAALTEKTAMVIDIREPHEHATGVASGAVLMPMGEIGSRLAEIPKPSAEADSKPVLLICRTQARSSHMAAQFAQAGYSNVRYVHGGMSAWSQQGLPTIKP